MEKLILVMKYRKAGRVCRLYAPAERKAARARGDPEQAEAARLSDSAAGGVDSGPAGPAPGSGLVIGLSET